MTDTNRSWTYDEFKSVGRDYRDRTEVAVYDSSHADFRDLEAEARRTLELLEVAAGGTLIDFGSGTGALAIVGAQAGAIVHAVDVSAEMIAYARQKAAVAGVTNITFHHAGFLSYVHPEGTADAIATTFAFHHLPDFWKGIALQRIYRMLKPGGRFYLHDVVLAELNALQNIAAFIEQQEIAGGAFLREDAEGHFRDEFSTYDWVIDGMLHRAGFQMVHKTVEGGVLATYLCQK